MFYYIDSAGFLTETTIEHPEWTALSHSDFIVKKALREAEVAVAFAKAVEANKARAEQRVADRQAKLVKMAELLGVDVDDFKDIVNGI